jgi:hypothetical protein
MTIIRFNSILYFNVLTQQQQEPVTESAQENSKCTRKRKRTEIYLNITKYLQIIYIRNMNSFSCRESVLEEDIFIENVKKFSFVEITHLAEGLCFNALLTLKVENCLFILCSRMPTMSKPMIQLDDN